MITWDDIYNLLGARDFISFISSNQIQDVLLVPKIIFILFTVFFFCAVMYFYINSSYLQYQFLQDATEFFSWQPYGLRDITRRWNYIMKKTESGLESDFKLAVVEADDFLYQTLDEAGYKGETFEELVASTGKKMLPNLDEIIQAHLVRNAIVHTADYALNIENARRILSLYESAVRNISAA